VQLLTPGRGKTKRAYMWVYRTTDFMAQRAVLFDFTLGRGGENPRRVLEDFSGTLVTDDFSGYHALAKQGVKPALCMAHARRKLFEVHKLNGSEIARHAVVLIAKLYEIERAARGLGAEARRQMRLEYAKPAAHSLHTWLTEQRVKLGDRHFKRPFFLPEHPPGPPADLSGTHPSGCWARPQPVEHPSQAQRVSSVAFALGFYPATWSRNSASRRSGAAVVTGLPKSC